MTYQTALSSVLIGAIGGVIVVLSIVGMDRLKIDDPVGAISVHGTVGIFGVLAVAIFGDAGFIDQILGLAVIFVWVFGVSSVVWYVIKITIGIRADEEVEYKGMDLNECGMIAYPEFVSEK